MSYPPLPGSVTALNTLPAPVVVAVRDAALGRMIAMALRLEGYALHLFTDGQKALEFLQVEPCAAAVLDAHLPTVDGVAISEHMRASSATVSPVPIILLLLEEDTLEEDALEANAATWQTRRPHLPFDAVFVIPFQIRDLVAAVAAAIGRPLPLHPRSDEPTA
jgi:DNA-binding response OmpR family regulator